MWENTACYKKDNQVWRNQNCQRLDQILILSLILMLFVRSGWIWFWGALLFHWGNLRWGGSEWFLRLLNTNLKNIIDNKPIPVWTRYTSIKIRSSSIHILTAVCITPKLHHAQGNLTLNQVEETIKSSHEMISFKLHSYSSNSQIYKDCSLSSY